MACGLNDGSRRHGGVWSRQRNLGAVIMTCRFATVACAIVFALAASAGAAQTLNTVKSRGMLNCGSNVGLAGFGIPDKQGNWTGFDVDFCRVVAAAIFNDPAKVKFV